MSIASLKEKIIAIAQNNFSSDGAITKQIGAISSSFSSTPAIIAKDLFVEGDLVSTGLLEIEGKISGTIKGNSVILREGGFVKGTIIAESLSISGKFDGVIKAKNINITSKANIVGAIEYGLLSVEDGACIEGQFKRLIS